MNRLGDYIRIRTGKRDANAAIPNGAYPFFTCAKEHSQIDEWEFDCECVLVAGNCTPHVSYYNGKFNVYQRVYVIESKNNDLLSVRFLYYFLKEYMALSVDRQRGAIEKFFCLDDFTGIRLDLPDLPTQLRIAGVLGSIDEKIELNRKKIAALEALAKTIYDYWFVQFDFPDAKGKPYKSSGGKMVWNEQLKREVPEGWEVVPLGELSNSEVVRVKTSDDVMPYVTTENLRPHMGGYACDERDVTTIVGGHYFSKNDILVSNIRPYFQKIWYADTHGVASSDVIKFHSKDNSALLYFTLARPDFFDYVMKGAKGSKMPRGDKAHIARYAISWGNCSLRGKVASLFQSVLERCNLLEKEISYWERQRDALLPLLMNGQVEVVG